MSVNRIRLQQTVNAGDLPFSLEAGESLKYRSPSVRQSLSIQLHNSNNPVKVNIAAKDGHIFLTNKRLVYVTANQGDMDSFLVDFAQVALLQFSHALKSPWFGANYWEFMFFSPEGDICDGFPKKDWFKGLITFYEGGLFDFVEIVNGVVNDVVNNAQVDDELPQYAP